MIDPGRTSRSAEEGPGGRKSRTGALAFPGDQGGCWGNAAHNYKRSGIPFQLKQKGAQEAGPLRPYSPSQVSPHTEGEDQQ
jgi:hypothetical protein